MGPLFLTGFMGAGKTTVGQALGTRLNMAVIDTDERIESAVGKRIKQIFAQEGEEAFRKYETDTLKKVTQDHVIITTGGGIVTRGTNRRWMEEHGTVVYLHCHPSELFERLRADTNRPLLRGKNLEEMTALFDKRLPLYKQASEVVDTTGKTVEDVVEEIARRLFNK